MANQEDKSKTPQGEKHDVVDQQEGAARNRARKWLRRAQAIVGIRTPGTRKRQGMCEAAERKARREMPYVDYPESVDEDAPEAHRTDRDARKSDVQS